MGKRMVVVCIACFSIMRVFVRPGMAELAWEEIDRGNVRLRSVLVDPRRPQTLYIASGSGALKSEDGGLTWKRMFGLPGGKGSVNALSFAVDDARVIFAATSRGMYGSVDGGGQWKILFRGRNDPERDCRAVAVLGGTIFVGTGTGLFISKDKGRSWQRAAAQLGRSCVSAIACSRSGGLEVFVACADGVFMSKDAGVQWRRVFVAHSREQAAAEGGEDDDTVQEEVLPVRCICIDPAPHAVYLATALGIYKSGDREGGWELLMRPGLLSRDIRCIGISRSILYAFTDNGIFWCRGGSWEALSETITAGEGGALALDEAGTLYAACDKGLFKARLQSCGLAETKDPVSLLCKDEPDIAEVQKAAMRYAEVEPEKISRWRRQAAWHAVLPKVTVGLDCDRDQTVSTSIWGTYGSTSGPGKYYIGPDDETSYRNKSWSASLSWDFGDLIWNSDQTSIDVRSKLMVELRTDILDEVTKIYFERVRVKAELRTLALEDAKKRFEKELRLKELSASLDAFTGGYFSQGCRGHVSSKG